MIFPWHIPLANISQRGSIPGRSIGASLACQENTTLLRRATGTSVGAAAGSRAHIQTDVLLGSERLPSVKTGVHQQPIFSGEAGLLGNGLLSQFRVTVDAGKSRLLLDRIP